ncbi:MAG: hypothetical protein JWR32_2705 [Mycobacterium sp.]|jgi:hypothetical protein|nr:hypothetical protein [Mycobacterium sp.]
MAVTPFQDLPLADRDRHWDADEAEKRVREWAGAKDEPNERYRQAFIWYDENRPDKFTSYKLPIADVVDGNLMAVPRAIIAAGAVLDGARGGVHIPDEDIEKAKAHIAKYYAKMGEKPPWERG